jgi:hypothetical protein
MSNTIFNNITLTKKIKINNKIIMYCGNTLPSGYVWCDGSNGTPNLKSRFIYGINKSNLPGNIGNSKVNYIPSHNHNITTINKETNFEINKTIGYKFINKVSQYTSANNENRGEDVNTTTRVHDHNVNNQSPNRLDQTVEINFNASNISSVNNNNVVNTGSNSNVFEQKYIYIGFIMKI